MNNPGDEDRHDESRKTSGAPGQATEAERHGGKQPANEHAEREFEDSAKEDGE